MAWNLQVVLATTKTALTGTTAPGRNQSSGHIEQCTKVHGIAAGCSHTHSFKLVCQHSVVLGHH